jgi:hypothetical protein
MIRRALNGEIESDLEAVLVSRADEPAEILQCAELRVDRVVATFGRTDRIGTAKIIGRRVERIVAPLAVRLPDRMKGRKIEDVESHAPDVRKAGDHVFKCAVALRMAGLRAWKQLIPARERGLRPLDVKRNGFMLRAECTLGRAGYRFHRRVIEQCPNACINVVAAERAERRVDRRRVARHGARMNAFEEAASLDQLGRDRDAGLVLHLDLVRERGVVIAPSLDGE